MRVTHQQSFAEPDVIVRCNGKGLIVERRTERIVGVEFVAYPSSKHRYLLVQLIIDAQEFLANVALDARRSNETVQSRIRVRPQLHQRYSVWRFLDVGNDVVRKRRSVSGCGLVTENELVWGVSCGDCS